MNDVTITEDCRRNNLVIVLKLELKQVVEEFDFDMFISFFFVVQWRSKGQRKLTEKCTIK